MVETTMPHIDEIKNELETLKEIILKSVPTEEIYVFGSYAYGTPHEDSDIDIYIVMKDDAPMRETDAMTEVECGRFEYIMNRPENARSIPVDILALKKKRFLYRTTGRTLEKIVAEKGVKIYG
ncbi:MAG: nucleotidyltransferase domain-containing protein [Chitinispirillales bacterium]|jgi:predicted nucleotidyltransferase|nr:nucleotidyltransferase domain-containing protein [Chitinispirillales bacterium]